MTTEKIKSSRWVIFEKFERNEIPYILNSTNLDVNDDELCICIWEQFYGGYLK